MSLVTAQANAGRTLAEIIAAADAQGLAALLNDVDIAADVLASSRGALIVAERVGQIFDRYAEFDPDARRIANAEVAAA